MDLRSNIVSHVDTCYTIRYHDQGVDFHFYEAGKIYTVFSMEYYRSTLYDVLLLKLQLTFTGSKLRFLYSAIFFYNCVLLKYLLPINVSDVIFSNE